MLVSDAIDELINLDGLDLTEPTALRLLNEGNVELCVRSRWTRATLDLGPTVADQTDYAIPDEVTELLDVYVDTIPYTNSDKREISRIYDRDLALRARGLWATTFDAAGVEHLTVYPLPQDGQALEAVCVVVPGELDTGDSFTAPEDFHRAVIEYVQGVSLGGTEDDMDRRQIHWDEFERQVSRLRARRITRSAGRPRAQIRIVGETA